MNHKSSLICPDCPANSTADFTHDDSLYQFFTWGVENNIEVLIYNLFISGICRLDYVEGCGLVELGQAKNNSSDGLLSYHLTRSGE